MHALTERNLSIRQFTNGVVEVELKRPAIERLVLSGGGAKGVAISGMVKALADHQALDPVRTLSGSSAGAISAAFLASGMQPADFDKLSDETNLVSLLDSQNKVLGPIQQVSSTLGRAVAKIPGKAGNIGQLLFDLMPRLQSKATPLETLIREKMTESIQACVDRASSDPQRSLSPASEICMAQIRSKGYVTFADLATLSKELPQIKQLNVTGTAMFDGRPQMVMFNASLTPDMDVARAAHISGSLPVVFAKPCEQQLPFQTDTQRTAFQDGGIMLNTPVLELYEPQFSTSVIPDSEQLVFKFESAGSGKKKDRGTLFSTLGDRFIGAPHSARHAQQNAGLAAFANQTVTVRLKTDKDDFTGTLQGTVNFSMATEHKNQLQHMLEIDVNQYLAGHQQCQTYTFASMGGALLALNESMFEAAALELHDHPDAAAVIEFRHHAQQALADLKRTLVAVVASQEGPLTLTAPLRVAVDALDRLGDAPGKRDWLARQLNQGNDPMFMSLLQAVKRLDAGSTGEKSPVMTGAIQEMDLRDIVTKSENVIREVIYPSLFRLGQPDANVALLRTAIEDLHKVDTREGFNEVLHRIADQYVSRTWPSSTRAFSSTTVDQARAWLIP
ncbi:patatin-like phospholipase family protein [Pseudomonas fluorescens]|uniref:patatin-like phospholipase family protein n=1 Tax=Pseudomonas fluorescens TaxID=294 RepID=UPI003525A07E